MLGQKDHKVSGSARAVIVALARDSLEIQPWQPTVTDAHGDI